MQIIDFSKELIPQAQELILSNYLEERACVPVLPEEVSLPPLDALAQNGLGAAAVEDGKLLGFLGAYGPWQPVFCTRDVSGVFSPLHAHAVQRENRTLIWQRLYQAAAEKWAGAGAASHAITLYAHDTCAKDALFMYGFGVRCMDLIRPVQSLGIAPRWKCFELPSCRQRDLSPLRRDLAAHLGQSPCFMKHDPQQLEGWICKKEQSDSRIFAIEADGQIAAYIEADDDGENFVSCMPGIINICGAYCLPKFRGTGAAQALLEYMLSVFAREGFTRLGVDCESFNPTALHFWSKYFDCYTHSIVRRIDDNAVL